MTQITDDVITPGGLMERELRSQPEMWARAAALGAASTGMPYAGARMAVIGCGTSWFIAQAFAALRERAGFGVTDAYTASEAKLDREYDVIVVISRSGTTTEVLELLTRVPAGIMTIAIVGGPDSPLRSAADSVIELSFADEQSVVQTRFATSALAYLRATLGEDLSAVIEQGTAALSVPLDDELIDAEQITFLGSGWTIGIATEAALKMRESAQAWTESYPALEYRHGPIAIAAPKRVVWMFGDAPEGLAADVHATGARFEESSADAMADLIRVHRVALASARRQNLNPDRPRHLTRSVILS